MNKREKERMRGRKRKQEREIKREKERERERKKEREGEEERVAHDIFESHIKSEGCSLKNSIRNFVYIVSL